MTVAGTTLRKPVAGPTPPGRERVGRLFDPVPARPVTRAAVALAGVLVLAAAGYSLARIGGPGPLDSVWAEDGSNFLTDAYGLPFAETILRPINGYYLVVPRLLAGLALLVPVTAGPAVITLAAAGLSGALAVLVYVAAGNTLRSPVVRAVAAAWIVAAPLAESTSTFGPNMLASLQFVEVYALFWMLLWTPTDRRARALQLVVVVGIVLSTFLAVFLLPLAGLRLWARRDRRAGILVALLIAGALFQSSALLLGLTTRANISNPRLDAWWAAGHYADWALPYSLVGERFMHDPVFSQPLVFSGTGGPWYWSGVALAWLVVTAAVVAAMRRRSDVDWPLALVAGGSSLVLLGGELLVQGRLELRHAYTPGLIAVVALLALVRPGTGARRVLPMVVLVSALAVSAAVNYRLPTTRSGSQSWSRQVDQSAVTCAEHPGLPWVITYTTPEWFVVLPCRLLR